MAQLKFIYTSPVAPAAPASRHLAAFTQRLPAPCPRSSVHAAPGRGPGAARTTGGTLTAGLGPSPPRGNVPRLGGKTVPGFIEHGLRETRQAAHCARRQRKDLADISCSCPQPRFLQHSLARPQPSLKHSGPARGTRPGQQQHGAAVECWLCLSSDRAARLCSCWMCPAPAPGSLTQQSPASQGACRWQGFPGHRQGLAVRFLQQTISVHWGSQENRKERL